MFQCFLRTVKIATLQIDFHPILLKKYEKYFLDFLASRQTLHKDVPTFSEFHRVPTDDVMKIILSSLTKSCTLDPWPTFLVNDYIDILIQPICQGIQNSLCRIVTRTLRFSHK